MNSLVHELLQLRGVCLRHPYCLTVDSETTKCLKESHQIVFDSGSQKEWGIFVGCLTPRLPCLAQSISDGQVEVQKGASIRDSLQFVTDKEVLSSVEEQQSREAENVLRSTMESTAVAGVCRASTRKQLGRRLCRSLEHFCAEPGSVVPTLGTGSKVLKHKVSRWE